MKNVYSASGDEKENITVLVTANAAGKIAPPMVVLKYVRIPSHISASVPREWGIGTTENGWMCGPTFFGYITNVFLPWLQSENIKRPVVLFMDGHVPHMTLHLSKFCSENGIVLIALFPNSTHLLQPMDVSVFRPLKNAWKQEVQRWRMDNSGRKLSKENFCPVFKKALEHISSDTIKNGFRVSGLCPFDVNNVDFQKISANKTITLNEPAKLNKSELKTFLKILETKMGQDKVANFKQISEKNCSTEDVSLFLIWKSAHQELQQNLEQNTITKNTVENGAPVSDAERRNCTSPTPGTSSGTCSLPSNPPFIGPEVVQSSECLPSNTTSHPFNIPSPFKRALFWPEETPNTKKRKAKEKIPSVVTSAAWQDYHKKKEVQKQRKIEEKKKKDRF